MRKRTRKKKGFIYKAGRLSMVLFPLCVILYIIINFSRIQDGLNLIVNEVKRAFTQYYGGIFHGELITDYEEFNLNYAALLPVFLEAFPVCYVIRGKGKRWLFFMGSFWVAALPFFAGLIPDDGLLLAYMLCIFPVFAISGENREKERLRTSIRQLVLLIAVLCLFVGLRIFPAKWYNDNFDAEKTKKDIQEATYMMESDLFRKLFHSMEDSASYAGGLNKGELGWLDEIKYTNKNALEITMPEKVKDDKAYSLFFRSYVGEDYKPGEFKAMGREQRRDKEALDSKYGMDVGELNSLWIRMSGDEEISNKAEISIKNIWVQDDYFAPYACTDAVGFNAEGNIEYKNKPDDTDTYEVECYYRANDIIYDSIERLDLKVNIFSGYSFNNDKIAYDSIEIYGGDSKYNDSNAVIYEYADFSAVEKDYREYVYKYDLRIPRNTCDRTIKAFQELDEDGYRKFLYDEDYVTYRLAGTFYKARIRKYIRLVKNYLADNTSYSLSPGHLPEDKDFTEYFLFEGKEGYCTYYAATATIAFRSLGIPARYVEGFKASKQDIDNARNNGDGTITFILKDVNAHAWVEIYIDGYGWFPVEVTPGYEQSEDAEFTGGNYEDENPSEDMSDEEEPGETDGDFEDEPDEDEYDPYAFNSPKPELTEGEADGFGFIGSIGDEKKILPYILAGLVLLLLGGIFLAIAGLRRRRIRQKLNAPVFAVRALCLYHITEKKLKGRVKNSKADSLYEILMETDGSIELRKGKRSELKEELLEIERIGEKAYFSGRDIDGEEWEKMKVLCKEVMAKIG